METTEEIIEYLYPNVGNIKKVRPSHHQLQELRTILSKITNMPKRMFLVKTRKREYVTVMQFMSIVLKTFTTLSLSDIGIEAGFADHATVLHRIKKVRNYYETEKKFRSMFNLVISEAEAIFLGTKLNRGWYKSISRELLKYALQISYEEINKKPLPISAARFKNKIKELEEIILDKDREIRLIRRQLEHAKIKNSYEYFD